MNLRRLALCAPLLCLAACDAPVPPFANAGTDQMVAVKQLVQLDGTGSASKITDPAGATISRYQWVFTQLPTGSAAALNRSDIAKPSFTPDLVGDYQVKLTVWDPNGSSSATVNIKAVGCIPTLAPITAAPATPNIGDDVTLSTSITLGMGCDDRSPYTYQWTITSLPAGSKAALLPATAGGSTAVSPTFHVDAAGDYNFAVRVTDQAGRWVTGSLKVTAGTCGHNAPSVSMITSTPATPNTGDITQLAATITSADTMAPCNLTESFSYNWILLTAPQGSSATLSAADATNPWFQPDLTGSYTVRLVATASNGLSSVAKDQTITVNACGGAVPTVNAVTPSTNTPILGQTVNLAATVHTNDNDAPCSKQETFTYAWALVSQPGGSTAKLQSANTATPSLVPDVAGPYGVQLTVTSSNGKVSAPSPVTTITAGTCGTSAPVAQIGVLAPFAVTAPAAAPPATAVQVPLGTAVQFDGSTSSDPDNSMGCALTTKQTLSYFWRIESLPPGSKATINDQRATNASFTPDVAGPYVVDLYVTDNTGLTSTAARVQVNGFNSQPTVAAGVGPYNSLVLDANQNPSIAFYDQARRAAMFATCTGPTCATSPVWSINTIEMNAGVGNYGKHISLAASSTALYTAYWDSANCVSHFAASTNGGKTWSNPATIEANANGCNTDNTCACGGFGGGCGQGRNAIDWRSFGAYPSVAVSPTSGRPVVAFVEHVAGANQMAICGGGNQAFQNAGFDQVRVAVCSNASVAGCQTNPTWNIVTVPGTASAGGNALIGYISASFDAQNHLHIVFRTQDTGNGNGAAQTAVGYAACTGATCDSAPAFNAAGPVWLATDVGFTDYVTATDASTTSLALDSNNLPSVAFFDSAKSWLRYSVCAGNCANPATAAWNGYVVDASGSVGQYASLAVSTYLPTKDQPRITYLGVGGLNYAAFNGGIWNINRLDASAGYTSLKLTPTDGPRVSHFGANAIHFFSSGN